jgi:uncharacterized membrane protein YfcA
MNASVVAMNNASERSERVPFPRARFPRAHADGRHRPPPPLAPSAIGASRRVTLPWKRLDGATLTWLACIACWAIASFAWLGLRVADGRPGAEVDLATGFIVLAGALVSSIAGFAFGPIAGIGLVHVRTDPVSLVVLVLVCSLSTQLYSVIAIRRHLRWRESIRYIAAGVPFTPVGVWALTWLPASACYGVLGTTIVAFGVFLFFRDRIRLRFAPNRAADVCCGAVSGVLAGLTGFPSAAVTVWCTLKGGTKEEQRAVFQPVLFTLQAASLVALLAAGRGPGAEQVAREVLYVPIALLAATAGVSIFRRLADEHFAMLVNGVLILSGLSMLVRAIAR